MFTAFWIIMGLMVVWAVSSGLIYSVVCILRATTLIQSSKILTFWDVAKYGEIIVMALAMAGVIAVILNVFGVIDLSILLNRPEKRRE